MPFCRLSSPLSNTVSCCSQCRSHAQHTKLELKLAHGHAPARHLRAPLGACSSCVCLHLHFARHVLGSKVTRLGSHHSPHLLSTRGHERERFATASRHGTRYVHAVAMVTCVFGQHMAAEASGVFSDSNAIVFEFRTSPTDVCPRLDGLEGSFSFWVKQLLQTWCKLFSIHSSSHWK